MTTLRAIKKLGRALKQPDLFERQGSLTIKGPGTRPWGTPLVRRVVCYILECSFMCNRNNRGPRTRPWGTPRVLKRRERTAFTNQQTVFSSQTLNALTRCFNKEEELVLQEQCGNSFLVCCCSCEIIMVYFCCEYFWFSLFFCIDVLYFQPFWLGD